MYANQLGGEDLQGTKGEKPVVWCGENKRKGVKMGGLD